MDATAAKRRSPSTPETTEPKPAPSISTQAPAPAPTPPAPKMTTASLVLPTKTVPSTQALKEGPESALKVPNWKGKRLSVALREAHKLGLTVTALDDRNEVVHTGDVLPAEPPSGYRVRRMLTAAGTPVEPGAEVQVRVREIEDVAAGY
jgi:hypothetical protein